MTSNLSNLEYERRAVESQEYAKQLRGTPHHWFKYYYERIVCVIVLLAVVIAGLFAIVQLVSGSSG